MGKVQKKKKVKSKKKDTSKIGKKKPVKTNGKFIKPTKVNKATIGKVLASVTFMLACISILLALLLIVF